MNMIRDMRYATCDMRRAIARAEFPSFGGGRGWYNSVCPVIASGAERTSLRATTRNRATGYLFQHRGAEDTELHREISAIKIRKHSCIRGKKNTQSYTEKLLN